MRTDVHRAPEGLHSVSFITGGSRVRALAPALGLGVPGVLRRGRLLFALWRSGDRSYVLAFCRCGWQAGSCFGPMVERAAVDHLGGQRHR